MKKNSTLKLGSMLLSALLLSACGTTALNSESAGAVIEDRNGSSLSGGAGSSALSSMNGSNNGAVPAVAADGKSPDGLPLVIYFDFDSFSIKSEYLQAIADHSKFLNADSNRKVMLEGHADERGTREYNLALGQERSEAVRRALGVLAVNDAQLEAVSFGEEKPAELGAFEEAWSKNRRVEIKYQ